MYLAYCSTPNKRGAGFKIAEHFFKILLRGFGAFWRRISSPTGAKMAAGVLLGFTLTSIRPLTDMHDYSFLNCSNLRQG